MVDTSTIVARIFSRAIGRGGIAAALLLGLGATVLPAGEARADRPARLVKNIGTDVAPCTRFFSAASPAVEAGTFAYFPSYCNGGELWRVESAGATMLHSFDSIGSVALDDMVLLGTRLVFTASDAANGWELWSSDGTPAGTTLLADINPGSASGSPEQFFVVGSLLFFVADDGLDGRELWRTDGTPGGTSMVMDIAPGAASSWPSRFFSTNGVALFAATVGSTTSLWRSDGTAPGTFTLSPVIPYDSFAPFWVDLGGIAVFSGSDAATGAEPWVTDGTVAGTFQLADLVPGPVVSNAHGFTAIGGRAVFAATSASGEEVWATDGTVAGTVQLADINPGVGGSFPGNFTPYNGAVYFSAAGELWRTDGTPAGTFLFADPDPTSSSFPGPFVEAGGLLFYTATTTGTGREIWRTDGTGPGTFMVEDIYPGPNDSVAVSPAFQPQVQLTSLNGLAFFVATDGVQGFEVWRSDGSAAGTFSPLDVSPLDVNFLPDIGPRVGSELLYLAGDADGPPGTNLWRTDGTAAGTAIVASASSSPSSDPEGFADLGGVAYFSAVTVASGRELWRSDGTDSGTTQLKEIAPGTGSSNPTGMTALGAHLYFSADDGAAGRELWRSDGSESGTIPFVDIEPGADGSDPQSFTRAGTHLFFTAATSAAGRELWSTDGTTTAQLADINPGDADSNPVDLVELGGKLYFFADDGVNRGLWSSDGTPGGTALVTLSNGSGLVRNSSALFFVSSDGGNGSEPWTSDGTALGTLPLADVNPGPASSNPAELTVVGERLFFIATAPASGRELWSSDGVTTALVADLTPGAGSSSLSALGGAGGLLYFSFGGGSSLWISDGTMGGTSPIDTLVVSGPVVDAGGVALFRTQSQPWRSDGTRAGTWQVSSYDSLPGSVNPTGFTVVGQSVFFAADDATHGNEPWVVPLADLLGCGDIETTCTAAEVGGAKLLLKDNADDSRDRFRLTMKIPGLGGIGDPTLTTTYEVCVYDRVLGVPQLAFNAVVPAIASYCDGSACWRRNAGTFNYTFADPGLSRSGIRRLIVKTAAGRTRITAVGRSTNLPMPVPAMSSLLHQDTQVTVQVKNTDGSCWGADFAAPARKNTLSLFRDVSE